MANNVPRYYEKQRYDRTTSLSPSLGGERRRPLSVPKVLPTEMGSVGKALQDIGEKMYKVEMFEQFNKGQTEYYEKINSLVQNAEQDKSWAELTTGEHLKRFESEASDIKADVLEKVDNEYARRDLDKFINKKEPDARLKVKGIAYHRQVDRATAQLVSDLNSLTDEAIRTADATVLASIHGKIAGGRNANLFGEEKTVELQDYYTKKVGYGISERLILDNPLEAYDMLYNKPPQFFSMLHEDDQTTLIAKAKTAQKRAENEQKEKNYEAQWEVQKSMEDSLSSIANTGTPIGGVEASIDAVFEKDRAAKLKAQYRRGVEFAQKQYGLQEEIKSATPEETRQLVKDLQLKNYAGTKGFAEQEKLHNWALTAIGKKQRMLNEDPMAYIRSTFPELDDAPPSTIIARQRRLGVNSSNLSLLTKSQAENMVASFEDMDGESIASTLAQLKEKHGEYFDVVYNDLTKAKLPVALKMVASLDPKKDMMLRGHIAEAYKLKDIEFYKAMGVEAQDIRKSVNETINSSEEVENIQRSIMSAGYTSENIELVRDIKTSIRKLSYLYIMRGDDEDEAVDKSVKGMIGKYFSFSDEGYRIPKDPNLDPDKLEEAAQERKRSVRASNLWNGEGDKTLYQNEEALERAAKGIRENGRWVNAPDGTGLVLVHDDVPVLDKKGNYITLDYDEVMPDNYRDYWMPEEK